MTNVSTSHSGRTVESCSAPFLRKTRYNSIEASRYLAEAHDVPVARATLDKLRSVGGGPEFERFGRAIFYQRDALDRWVAGRLSPPLSSTSEANKYAPHTRPPKDDSME